MSIKRSLHVPVAIGVGIGVSALVLSPIAALGAFHAPAAATTMAPTLSSSFATATSGYDYQVTKTLTRTHLIDGVTNQVVDSRSVSVRVQQTHLLRDRQGVLVSWTGAKPTQGITGDPNADVAIQQEYPVVVLECRGVDSTSVPVAKRLSPETCWTNSPIERYGSAFSFQFAPWRVDRYATPADRVQWVNQPKTPACGKPPVDGTVHYIPFNAANGTVYPIGVFACGGIPPEAANISSVGLPDNATWAPTSLDGTGNTRFDIRTADDNASLGCSDTVACSLVVIPIMGISCDTAALSLPPADQPANHLPQSALPDANSQCLTNGNFLPGQRVVPNSNEAEAVSGKLWWSASNWRNRFVVPLTFAPSANLCALDSTTSPLYFFGSELAIQATGQWAPAFCTNPKLFTFRHVQTPEPQARSLLKLGNIEASLSSAAQPGGWTTPTVSVPVAATGWVIGYNVADKEGHLVSNLKLTPRLLAKLLTSSYSSEASVQSEYTALSKNPVNITLDPEFRALNPTVPVTLFYSEAAASLYALSSDSDVMYALTSYIYADPDARAFLNGTPDPWGMVVNPNYNLAPPSPATAQYSLPTNSWPLLDAFKPLGLYQPGLNDCLAAVPVPWLPLVASPTQRMINISLALQYGFNFAQTSCYQPNPGFPGGQKLTTAGRQYGGSQFVIGVSSLGDAVRYGFGTASLLTLTNSSAIAKFTDATGRTFVPPTPASLAAALALFQPDKAAGIWTLDYSALRTAPTAAVAYPGTALVNASIPTQGLSKLDAARYVTWLDIVTTSGQVPGLTAGTLAGGFLPLSDGPAKMANFAAVAGPAILAQKGKVPGLLDNPPKPTPSPTPTTTATPTATTTSSGGGGSSITPSASPTPTKSSAKRTPTPSVSPTSASTTPANPSGPLGSILPTFLVVALAAGAAASFMTLRTLRGGL